MWRHNVSKGERGFFFFKSVKNVQGRRKGVARESHKTGLADWVCREANENQLGQVIPEEAKVYSRNKNRV